MKPFLKGVYLGVKKILGVDLLVFLNTVISLPWYINSYFRFKKQLSSSGDNVPVTLNMQLADRNEGNGTINTHYFQQDLLVAQYVYRASPVKHVDIGSRVDGFIAHVASFREIETLDIRPQVNEIDNVKFVQLDLMNVGNSYENYCDSVSSLHAFEHFGLGRYGDPINIKGHIIAINNVHRMLKSNGIFYFSTPIGPYRIEFNAHRVFSLKVLIETIFRDKFTIERFSYVDDIGQLHNDVVLTETAIATTYGCNFGCGIFVLRKVTL